ncbi:MAG TPA: exodeoxyribonuclease I [Candidatus Saccharimonadales bacterium]|nr:exodeoxyribonuclease I [Candidatus Saccharimonadales bacterium]
MPSEHGQTFFFYDLETSGINPRRQRVMQFAGQRTDMDLRPIGEPQNFYVALSDEVLPDAQAVMITGITPQKSREEGYNEADFCRILIDEVCTPGTIMTGFNNVHFDDEFLRYTLYRNFHDPYEWAWVDNRSRWDLLDVVRMTRALRPDGITWPVNDKGAPTNRLEELAKANSLSHEKAHDALSDVYALIAVAGLVKQHQPQLFEYMLNMRHKKTVEKLINLDNPQPFLYTDYRFPAEHGRTTIAYPIAPGTRPGSVLVYDLRHDPSRYAGATPQALASALFADYESRKKDSLAAVPVKELAYNKCPAVAPYSVFAGDQPIHERLQLTPDVVQDNLRKLLAMPDFGDRLREAFEIREPYEASTDVDAKLYDGFINDKDKVRLSAVRAASPAQLADFHPDFADERLGELLLRYKARNFPQILSQDERVTWEEYRAARLTTDMPSYAGSLDRLTETETSSDKQFLLSELRLWAESIAPTPDELAA